MGEGRRFVILRGHGRSQHPCGLVSREIKGDLSVPEGRGLESALQSGWHGL